MEIDKIADSYIKNKPILNFVPIETYNAFLVERIATLEALENPGTEEPIPDSENPEGPVE